MKRRGWASTCLRWGKRRRETAKRVERMRDFQFCFPTWSGQPLTITPGNYTFKRGES